MDCKGAGSFGGVEGQSPRGCRAEPCKAKASNKAKSEKINTQHQNKPNKKIENELNIKLPQDYKSFLLQNNGGSPVKDWVFDFTQIIPESGSPFENSSVIQDFSKLSEIPFFYGNLIGEELIPEKYLPIASDPGGNQILLCADENNYGKIYFADHETYDPETDYWLMTELTDSFTEFINKLYSDE